MKTRPWPEWRKEKPVSTRRVLHLLRGFDIPSRAIRTESGKSAKGYRKTDFDDTLSRYTPSQSVTPSQPNGHRSYSDSQSVTEESLVTVWESLEANSDSTCDGVTDENTQNAGGRPSFAPPLTDARVSPRRDCRSRRCATNARGKVMSARFEVAGSTQSHQWLSDLAGQNRPALSRKSGTGAEVGDAKGGPTGSPGSQWSPRSAHGFL